MKSCTDVQLGEAELKIRTRCAGGDCLGVRDEGLVEVELLDSKFEYRYPLTVFRPESESETRIGYSLRGPFAAPQHRTVDGLYNVRRIPDTFRLRRGP